MITVWNKIIVTTVYGVVMDIKAEVRGALLRDVTDLGTDLMVTCPFHKGGQERRPSMGISKQEVIRNGRTVEAGTCHCLTCGWTGDLPKLVSEVLGLGDRMKGFKWLNDRYNFGTEGERAELDLNMSRVKSKKSEPVMVTHYIEQLKTSTKATDYLTGRKLLPEVIEKFGIGYDTQYDSIVMPLVDRNGVVVATKARSIQGKKFHNSKGGDKAKIVFGLYQAIQECPTGDRKLWIVESEIDAMTLCGYGEVAVAIMGSHISLAQCSELCKSPFRRVVAGLDNDEAGRKGNRNLKDTLIPMGFRIDNVRWNTDKKDFNELDFEEFKRDIALY